MDQATVIMADLKPVRVLDAIDLAAAGYTADNVFRKVVRILSKHFGLAEVPAAIRQPATGLFNRLRHRLIWPLKRRRAKDRCR